MHRTSTAVHPQAPSQLTCYHACRDCHLCTAFSIRRGQLPQLRRASLLALCLPSATVGSCRQLLATATRGDSYWQLPSGRLELEARVDGDDAPCEVLVRHGAEPGVLDHARKRLLRAALSRRSCHCDKGEPPHLHICLVLLDPVAVGHGGRHVVLWAPGMMVDHCCPWRPCPEPSHDHGEWPPT